MNTVATVIAAILIALSTIVIVLHMLSLIDDWVNGQQAEKEQMDRIEAKLDELRKDK